MKNAHCSWNWVVKRQGFIAYFVINLITLLILAVFTVNEVTHMPGIGKRSVEDVVGAAIAFITIFTLLVRVVIILFILLFSKDPKHNHDAFKPERLWILAAIAMFVSQMMLGGAVLVQDTKTSTPLGNWLYLLIFCLPLIEAWSGSFGKLSQCRKSEVEDKVQIHIYNSSGRYTCSQGCKEDH